MTGWAILTAVGAFGLAASGMATLLDRRRAAQQRAIDALLVAETDLERIQR